MSNSLLTTSKITREAVHLFVNSNLFIQNVDRQYDDEFGRKGEKIGSQLRVRLPNDYVPVKGPAASIQDTTEQQTVLTMATQAHVDISFATVDLLLSLDDFSERILSPAMNNLAGTVATDIMSTVDQGYITLPNQAPSAPLTATTGGACNLAYSVDGSGALVSPTSSTLLDAIASLQNNSAPDGERKLVLSPRTNARIVNSLTGLLNPVTEISSQYRSGEMKSGLGYRSIFTDQTVINHTTGTFTTGTTSSAVVSGYTLPMNAISGTLNVGDIITVAGVYAVNRVTKQSTGELRQFVVTSAVANGGTSITVYPAITPAVNGNSVQYQTVLAGPANGATVTQLLPNTTYRKNVAYAPEAITMATGDLPLPKNVDAARAQYDGVSMRMVTQYMVGTDQEVTRIDVLYGALMVRPEWAVAVADKI